MKFTANTNGTELVDAGAVGTASSFSGEAAAAPATAASRSRSLYIFCIFCTSASGCERMCSKRGSSYWYRSTASRVKRASPAVTFTRSER